MNVSNHYLETTYIHLLTNLRQVVWDGGSIYCNALRVETIFGGEIPDRFFFMASSWRFCRIFGVDTTAPGREGVLGRGRGLETVYNLVPRMVGGPGLNVLPRLRRAGRLQFELISPNIPVQDIYTLIYY